MKKTTKLTLISILTIALCISLIVGATFALFTDEKSSGIDVNAGVVQLDINDEKVQLDVWSAKWSDADGAYINDHKTLNADNRYEFTAGGFASLDSETLALDLERMVPGDGAKLTFGVTNNSNILIKYRLVISIKDNGLLDSLEISYAKDNANIELNEAEDYLYSDWFTTADADVKDLGTFSITVQLPIGTDNRAQDKSCSIDVSVFAVQINGQITDTEKLKEKEVVLNSALLDGVVATGIDSKSLVVGSWSTYADVVGGEFKEGALVANNNNVRAFEHDDKVYVLVYGKLVADTDYDDQDGLFCQYDFEEVDLSDVDFSTLTANTLGYMFEASNLKVVNFSGADLSKLTSMSYLFAFCSQLEEVYFNGAILKNLPASDESAMSYVFHGCTSLKKVDFSEADLTNVGKISSMFWNGYRTSTSVNVGGNGGSFSSSGTPTYACTNLEYVSFADATFENVTAILYDIFKGAENLKYVNFANCDLHNLTSISWFGGQTTAKRYTPALETVIFTGANLSGVQNLQYWFRYCANLETVDFRNADIRTATSLEYAFASCTNLQTVDFHGAQLDGVTKLGSMFASSPSLVKVDFAGAFKSTITSATSMFPSTNLYLETIDFSGCDFSGIGGASNAGCMTIFSSSGTPVLKSVNFSGCNFLGTNANHYNQRFYKIATLETVNFSNAKLPATSLTGMFYQCTSLTSVDFSGAELASVTTLGNTLPFSGCTSLETVNFSGADLSNLTTTSSMFNGCTALTTVYLWTDFANVTTAVNMFNGCSSLVNIFVDAEMPETNIVSNSNMFTGCTSLPGFVDAKSSHAHTGDDGYFTVKQ